MKTLEEIKLLCIGDNDLMNVFKKHLNIIKVVDQNFDHIQDLEVLINLLKGGSTPYIKEYYPLHDEVIRFCAIIAENTRANHYRNDDKFDDVYIVLSFLSDIES